MQDVRKRFPFRSFIQKIIISFCFFVCVCSMARVPAFLFFSFGKPEQENVGVASKKSSVRGREEAQGELFFVSVSNQQQLFKLKRWSTYIFIYTDAYTVVQVSGPGSRATFHFVCFFLFFTRICNTHAHIRKKKIVTKQHILPDDVDSNRRAFGECII